MTNRHTNANIITNMDTNSDKNGLTITIADTNTNTNTATQKVEGTKKCSCLSRCVLTAAGGKLEHELSFQMINCCKAPVYCQRFPQCQHQQKRQHQRGFQGFQSSSTARVISIMSPSISR